MGSESRQRGQEQERVDRHKDGSVRAREPTLDGELHGYWEWFRKDGTKLGSGHFDRAVQVGEWTTYDAAGQVYKVTVMKPKGAGKSGRRL